MSVILDTPAGIAFAQLCARRAALRLEARGMRRSGRSALAICKEAYGLQGSRAAVLAQLDDMISAAQARQAQRSADWSTLHVCSDGSIGGCLATFTEPISRAVAERELTASAARGGCKLIALEPGTDLPELPAEFA